MDSHWATPGGSPPASTCRSRSIRRCLFGGPARRVRAISPGFRDRASSAAISRTRSSGARDFTRLRSRPNGSRGAPGAVGADFFINVRTDLFLKAPQETHDAAMLDEAIERVRAYAEAGASGFLRADARRSRMLGGLCGESPIPVNFMTYPGCPSTAEVAATGVARISHGPVPVHGADGPA